MSKDREHCETTVIDENSQVSIGKALKKVDLKKGDKVSVYADGNCIIIKKFKE